jgi:hypothetical protein
MNETYRRKAILEVDFSSLDYLARWLLLVVVSQTDGVSENLPGSPSRSVVFVINIQA